MGSLVQTNFGGSGKPKTRKLWAATKKRRVLLNVSCAYEIRKFSTKDEVEKYFNNEKLECLICGKLYTCLGTHIAKSHDITCKEYSLIAGLPVQRGLAGTKAKERWSKNASVPNFDKLREFGLKPKKGIAQTKPKCWLEQQSGKAAKAGSKTCKTIKRDEGRFVSKRNNLG